MISVLWVLCWVPFGLPIERILTDIFFPRPRIDSPYMGLGMWVIWGALSGLAFAIVLGFGERGRPVASLSAARVIGWGALGPVIVAVLYLVYLVIAWPRALVLDSAFWVLSLILVGVSAVLGLICAVITLSLMRASTPRAEDVSKGAA